MPAFFSGATTLYQDSLKFNVNTHPPVKNSTLEALRRIPAIQGEFEFYEFIRQRFEKVYDTFITNSGK